MMIKMRDEDDRIVYINSDTIKLIVENNTWYRVSIIEDMWISGHKNHNQELTAWLEIRDLQFK